MPENETWIEIHDRSGKVTRRCLEDQNTFTWVHTMEYESQFADKIKKELYNKWLTAVSRCKEAGCARLKPEEKQAFLAFLEDHREKFKAQGNLEGLEKYKRQLKEYSELRPE